MIRKRDALQKESTKTKIYQRRSIERKRVHYNKKKLFFYTAIEDISHANLTYLPNAMLQNTL